MIRRPPRSTLFPYTTSSGRRAGQKIWKPSPSWKRFWKSGAGSSNADGVPGVQWRSTYEPGDPVGSRARPPAGREAVPGGAGGQLSEVREHVRAPRARVHPLPLLWQPRADRQRVTRGPGAVRVALRPAPGVLVSIGGGGPRSPPYPPPHQRGRGAPPHTSPTITRAQAPLPPPGGRHAPPPSLRHPPP